MARRRRPRRRRVRPSGREGRLDGHQEFARRRVPWPSIRAAPDLHVELVEGADRLDLRMVLRHPLPVEEAGRALVARAGRDAHCARRASGGPGLLGERLDGVVDRRRAASCPSGR